MPDDNVDCGVASKEEIESMKDTPDFIRVLDLHLCSTDTLKELANAVIEELRIRIGFEEGGLLTPAELAAIHRGKK